MRIDRLKFITHHYTSSLMLTYCVRPLQLSKLHGVIQGLRGDLRAALDRARVAEAAQVAALTDKTWWLQARQHLVEGLEVRQGDRWLWVVAGWWRLKVVGVVGSGGVFLYGHTGLGLCDCDL